MAVSQSIISVGDVVPLPTYADGSPASDSEIFWTALLWRADLFLPGIMEYGYHHATATFSGRHLIDAKVNFGTAQNIQILVNVVAVRPHDNRRSNR